MSEQPTLSYWLKTAIAAPGPVETPLGRLVPVAVEPAEPGSWAFEAGPVPFASAYGGAKVGLVASGRDGGAPPSVPILRFAGGTSRKGLGLAWSLELPLDPATALPFPGGFPGVGMTGGPFRIEESPEVRQGILDEVRAAVHAWAAADPGYAARVQCGFLRLLQARIERGVEEARTAYLAACRARDMTAALARQAESVAARREGRISPWPQKGSPDPHVELRGFAGTEALDESGLDEVVASAPSMVHVEKMDDDTVWMGVYLGDGRRLVVNFFGAGHPVTVSAEFDDDGMD